MTKDDILKMARESGLELYGHGRDQTNFQFILCRFANEVAAAEREACAQIVEQYTGAWDDQGYALAQAIRARGEK